jgi:voltage-gated sodium channel
MPDDVDNETVREERVENLKSIDDRSKPDERQAESGRRPFVFGSTKKMLDNVTLDASSMVPKPVDEDEPMSPESPDSAMSPLSAGAKAKRRMKWSSKNRAESGLLSDDDWVQLTMDEKNRSFRRVLKLFRSIIMSAESDTGHWIHSNQASFIFCSLIVINAIYMGLEMELAPQPPTKPWEVADYAFLVLFTIELLLRIVAEKRSFIDSSWNWFDFAIVSVSVVDALSKIVEVREEGSGRLFTLLRIFRVIRVVRILRVIRLLRFLRELYLLAKGIVGALRALTWAMFFLLLVLYVFAIVATTFFGRPDPGEPLDPKMDEWFGGLGKSLFTLFQIMTLEGWHEIARHCMEKEGFWVAIVFILVIVLTNLTLLNLVTGVILENVMAVSNAEDDEKIRKQEAARLKTMKIIRTVFELADADKNGELTLAEFQTALLDEEVVQHLTNVDIPRYEAEDLFLLLDVDRNGFVSIEEFVEGCMRVKGEAKAKHLLALQYDVHRVWIDLTEQLQDLTENARIFTARKAEGSNDEVLPILGTRLLFDLRKEMRAMLDEELTGVNKLVEDLARGQRRLLEASKL